MNEHGCSILLYISFVFGSVKESIILKVKQDSAMRQEVLTVVTVKMAVF